MKLSDFFKKKNSGDVAKDRLKMVLVSDRSTCAAGNGILSGETDYIQSWKLLVQ